MFHVLFCLQIENEIGIMVNAVGCCLNIASQKSY
jgi:hypothetical protein